MICLNDLHQSLSETSFYLHADDSSIFYQDKEIHKIDVLTKEFSTLCEWFVDRSRQFFLGKIKVSFF